MWEVFRGASLAGVSGARPRTFGTLAGLSLVFLWPDVMNGLSVACKDPRLSGRPWCGARVHAAGVDHLSYSWQCLMGTAPVVALPQIAGPVQGPQAFIACAQLRPAGPWPGLLASVVRPIPAHRKVHEAGSQPMGAPHPPTPPHP